MRHATKVLIAGLALGITGPLGAQATGMPSYNAPYRAFTRSEIGGVVSFPNGDGVAFEGVYRIAKGRFDLGFRGGMWAPGDGASSVVLLGAEGRQRVITRSQDFPLDGAVTVGIGGQLTSDVSALAIPVGLSLGRRVGPKDSSITIVPYAQPTAVLVIDENDTNVRFTLGLGADFKLSRNFDARISVGIGDINGLSLAAVWLR
jgi:hypothetical protein